MSNDTERVIVHKDAFTLVTTLISAALNLVVVAIVCFLLVPRVDQATAGADLHLAELRALAQANREEMAGVQAALDRNRREVERVRSGVARLIELLERLERRGRDKDK